MSIERVHTTSPSRSPLRWRGAGHRLRDLGFGLALVVAATLMAPGCGGSETTARDDPASNAPVEALPAPERTAPPAPDDVDESDLPPPQAPSEDGDWMRTDAQRSHARR